MYECSLLLSQLQTIDGATLSVHTQEVDILPQVGVSLGERCYCVQVLHIHVHSVAVQL